MESENIVSHNSVIDDQILHHWVQLFNLTAGHLYTQLIYAAVKICIADFLENGPKSSDYLAEETESNPDAIYRLLRTLSHIGLFKETLDRTFELMPMGELLSKNHPMSLRPFALLCMDPVWREPWGNIIHSIKTGENALEYSVKKSFFEYLDEHEDTREQFNKLMNLYSNINCPVIAASYPFNNFGTIIDIGGGYGSLLSHILKQHPMVNGVLFDLPDVVKCAPEIDNDIASRCEIVGGDFFIAVPEGGDIYIMQDILHDWNDELALKILTNCRNAMADNGRLLIVEFIPATVNNFLAHNHVLDLHMLITTKDGRQRTEPEFRRLFKDAGLELIRIIPTDSLFRFSIIEGEKS